MILTGLRLFTWETAEERRSVGLVLAFFCVYMPIELGMDTRRRIGVCRRGTCLTCYGARRFWWPGDWHSYLPVRREVETAERKARGSRLLVETLCPLLIATGVFALAASIASQHAVLALTAIFLLMIIQGLHAGVLQLNYVTGGCCCWRESGELRNANATLQQLSLLDPLTRVANRRRFDAALDGAWRRAIRKSQMIALLIIDLDYFKGINDKHGHTYGDECLVTVARLVQKQRAGPMICWRVMAETSSFFCCRIQTRKGRRWWLSGFTRQSRRRRWRTGRRPLRRS